MSAEIVAFPDARPKGNGAREALVEIYGASEHPEDIAVWLLLELWERGFKVVPLEPSDV